eukprot:TRINITY_DN21724_c0_g1_i1.p1 TRINITY_DN21724_c0_g1~~TRINITY_DN21724_c0_g1_i1.p1  ORF type:complete len:130 (-),score=7.38 TRINITY_DN21724_c0_g1_i1:71-460(-)
MIAARSDCNKNGRGGDTRRLGFLIAPPDVTLISGTVDLSKLALLLPSLIGIGGSDFFMRKNLLAGKGRNGEDLLAPRWSRSLHQLIVSSFSFFRLKLKNDFFFFFFPSRSESEPVSLAEHDSSISSMGG